MEECAAQRATSARNDRYGTLPLSTSLLTPPLVATSTRTAMMPSSPSTVASALGTSLVEACPRPLAGSSTQTSSPSECSLIASTSPLIQSSSTETSFAVPSTASSWMVRSSPHAEKATAIAPLLAAPVTLRASPHHPLSAVATSDSPSLPFSRTVGSTTMSSVALHDAGELKKVDAQSFVVHCDPSGKQAQRQGSTTSLSPLASAAETTHVGPLKADCDSSVSATLRRLFRRASAQKNVENRGDDAALAGSRNGKHDGTASPSTDAQGTAHCGRSIDSGGAEITCSASPITSSIRDNAPETAQMATTAPSTTPAVEAGQHPPRASHATCETAIREESVDHKATAATAPESQPQPRQPCSVTPQADFVGTSSQQQCFSVAPRTLPQACSSIRSGAATVPKQSLLCSLASLMEEQLVHACGTGNVGADSTTPFIAVDHFSSAVEKQSWSRYSKASSSVSLDIGDVMDDEVYLDGGREENMRSALSGVVTASIASAPVTANSSRSASATRFPPALSDTAGAAVPVEATASADASAANLPLASTGCTSPQPICATGPATAAKPAAPPPQGNQPPSHLFVVSSPHLGNVFKSAATSPLPPSTFTCTPLASSSATSGAHESTRHRVRAGSQPVASSCLLFNRGGAKCVATSLAAMQRVRTTEGVYFRDHRCRDSNSLRGAHQRPAPPPPPPPPSRIPSPLRRAAAYMGGGFSSVVHTAHEHHRGLGCDALGQLSVSPGSARALPEQQGPQGFPAIHPPSSTSLFRPRTDSVVADHDHGFSGRRSAVFSKLGSLSSSMNVVNTPRLSLDDSTSCMSSLSTIPRTHQSTPVDATPQSPQHHRYVSHLDRNSFNSSPIRNVRAGAHELSTSEAGAMPNPEVLPSSLRHSESCDACVVGRCGDRHRQCSGNCDCGCCGGCAQLHSDSSGRGPAASVSPASQRDVTPTSVTSSFGSLAAAVTSAASHLIPLSVSLGNLTAPMSKNGSNSAYQPWPLGGSAGNSIPCLHDGFTMRPDAETLQGLPRGKVPRIPGCSIRDWAAHLSAKEEDLRRQEQQHHDTPHPNHGDAPRSGAAPRAKPNSTGVVRTARLPRMTPQEVATHNTPDDLWIVVRNVVYDCTLFQRYHPGGEKLLLACGGRDATAVYDRFHAWVSCESFMAPYAVGVLAPPESR
ncbi:hypothetical protein CUR178_03893 [Leishmania enriettii]|uniref:Cytochrome b5 heme-binding domain-containing protein n=1 Tax=Leishmania enriettii TaxID=5663 RepID=A0A836KN71_LEIEN|nr:hypothetical protein CUR178_03893 [Leishmania enriettii]